MFQFFHIGSKVKPKLSCDQLFKQTSIFLSLFFSITLDATQIKNYYYNSFLKSTFPQLFVDFLSKSNPILGELANSFTFLLSEQDKLSRLNHQLTISNQHLTKTIDKLNKQIEKLNERIEFLEDQYSQLEMTLLKEHKEHILFPFFKKAYDDPKNFLFLYIHLTNVFKNKASSNGNRYYGEIGEIQDTTQFKELKIPSHDLQMYMYSILSFIPEYWYNIIAQFFCLPSHRTAITYRRKLQESENLSPSNLTENNIFSRPYLLMQYILGMWKNNLSDVIDNRYVLAIDAASLKVNAGIHPNGETFGLVHNVQLSPFEYQYYKNNFKAFLKDYPDRAHNVFVILLCPIDPKLKPIILSRTFSTKGNATQSEVNNLKDIRSKLSQLGYKCVGFASDGDNQYQSYATDFAIWMVAEEKIKIEDIMEPKNPEMQPSYQTLSDEDIHSGNYDVNLEDPHPNYLINSKEIINLIRLKEVLNTPLLHHICMSEKDPWFQDVLHMLKNHRYHLLRNRPIQLVYGFDVNLSHEYFLLCLNHLSEWVLDNSQGSKMDDRLVFPFFDWSSIQELLKKDPRLMMIFLPSSLLLQVFFNRQLTKKERYDLLCFATAIMIIQRVLYTEDIKHKNPKKSQSVQKDQKIDKSKKDEIKKNTPLHPFNKAWLDKFIILAASVARLFADKKGFDLSDCGSHLLEHLFGTIRRLCAGDDSQVKFDQAIEKSICLNKWLQTIGFIDKVPGRLPQDSAVKVESSDDFNPDECFPFGSYVGWAIRYFLQVGFDISSFPKPQVMTAICKQLPVIEFTFEIKTKKQNTPTTQNQKFAINCNGNRNHIRYLTSNQDSKLNQNL